MSDADDIVTIGREHVQALRDYCIPRTKLGTWSLLDKLIDEVERLRAELAERSAESELLHDYVVNNQAARSGGDE